MKRIVLTLGLLVALAGSGYAQTPVTADEIVQRYIEKSGVTGDAAQKAMGKYTSRSMVTAVLVKGKEPVVQYGERVYDSAERRIYIKIDSEDKKQRSALAATKDEGWYYGWPQFKKALKFKEKELTKVWLRDYTLVSLPQQLTDPYRFNRTLGEEKEIEGRPCHCVIVTPKANAASQATYYFDKETGMLSYVEEEGGSCSYKEYRTYGPITIATLTEGRYSESLQKLTKVISVTTKIQDVRLGVADESLFTKEAVQDAFKEK